MEKTNDKFLFALGGFLLGAVTVWVISNTTPEKSLPVMGRGISQANIGTIDAHFIEQMIPHHEDAVTMSNLALEKAQSDEVRKLAQDIITSQTKEIEQMKDWYEEWYGREVPKDAEVMNHHGMGRGGMHMGMMGDSTDIERLVNASDFDREFLEQMIPHHQMAVMMAQMLKNGTDRAEMKKLADDIIKTQTEEINLMRGWLREG